jgi:hypothetical protein
MQDRALYYAIRVPNCLLKILQYFTRYTCGPSCAAYEDMEATAGPQAGAVSAPTTLSHLVTPPLQVTEEKGPGTIFPHCK